jgi:pimeloyl-[acyl-carrier protein] methyl ester esterase
MLLPYHETEGQGPELVLLHGWGMHAGIFDLIRADLTPHYRVTFIDLPGFGRSPIPSVPYSLDLLRDQVLAVAPEKAHYLGWSLGGLVATKIALDRQERVNKLVTLCSNPRFLQGADWPHAMKPEVIDNFTRALEDDYQATLLRFIAISTMGSETQKEDLKALKERLFVHGTPAPGALRGGLALLHDADLRAQLPSLTVPLLRLYGQLDALVPAKVGPDVQALLPSSPHHVFKHASHAPFLSHKREFLDVLNGWLRD